MVLSVVYFTLKFCSEPWSRPRPRGDYRGAPRDRGYSPSVEPQQKRLRHDYYPPHEGYYNHYQPYHQPQHRYVTITLRLPFIHNPVPVV